MNNRGHWASSDVTENDVISGDVIFQFAIFCDNLKILCRVVFEILD